MKSLRAFISFILLGAIIVPAGLAQQKSTVPFEPKYDREIFKKSGTSIARGDLLACRNEDAQIIDGGDVNIDEFAKMLHGVWVNKNGRSLHGVQVETDNVFYIDMNGSSGTGVLLDRNNLNDFSLTDPYLSPGSKLRNVATPLTMSFVSCTYDFVDRYIKVSDELPVEVLAASTRVKMSKKVSLEQAWRQIISAGYFESFDMLIKSREPGAARRKVNMATLGDGQRMAVTPDGTKVDEKGIQDGLVPGAEYNLPMMVGGFFKITLTAKSGDGRQFQGVQMHWDAEYRATGVNLKPGDTLYGIEEGTFAKEGDSYVSAKRTETSKSGEAITIDDHWVTSEGGDKNQLVTEAIVKSAGGATENSSALQFDRVVIGAPGLETLQRRGAVSSRKKQHR